MIRKVPRISAHGFTLVELMVALTLGLVLSLAMSSVYLFSKSAFSRQDQLASIQQNVRTAFEYLASDTRMVGHLGCATGKTPYTTLSAAALATNFALGVEGYEYASGNALTISSNAPSDDDVAASWQTNTDTSGVQTIPVSTISGGTGLTPGSDVLVIRTVVGKPQRLTAATAASGTSLNVQPVSGGKCSNGTTNKVSGFCSNSYGLVASCTGASTFAVSAAASSGALTVSVLGGNIYSASAASAAVAEVFPMQTIAYYVKLSESGTTTSLYRRVFNGDPAAGVEQELIEGVESLQLTYGRDTSSPLDGTIDDYVTAQTVANWNGVVAVRMSLLMRAPDPVPGDVAVAASGKVNNVTVTYPTAASGARLFDRRVFTTTVALRNRIS